MDRITERPPLTVAFANAVIGEYDGIRSIHLDDASIVTSVASEEDIVEPQKSGIASDCSSLIAVTVTYYAVLQSDSGVSGTAMGDAYCAR